MGKLKKFACVAFALVLAFAMSVVPFASADETKYTLTLNNTGKTAHTFEVYQIFKGDLSTAEDGTVTLSNIEWGENVSDSGKTALGDAKEYAKTITSANVETIAETLSGYLAGTSKTVTVNAGEKGTVEGLTPGYYFVKDTDKSQSGEKASDNSAYTKYILEVVKNTTASTKLDVPTVVKKVKDINESTSSERTDWQDSADYKIGQDIPYQITGTLPSNYDKYEKYYYQFTDTMSKGLTYTADTAKIMVDETDITSSFKESVTTNDDGSTTVTWTCDNLKGIEGVTLSSASQVIVNYNCVLNSDAVMGSAGNPNTVYLTYSNNPNKGGDGDHGNTPEDKNIVFTYNVTVNKYSESVADANKLTGAGFTLYKKIMATDKTTSWVAVGDEVKGEALTTFTWNRVDDGDYKLVETTVPAGYNKMADVEFTVSAAHDALSDNPTLTSLTGSVTSGSATFAAATDYSGLSTNVINNKGSQLPSTGGMGTTLFYIFGGILVAGAAIALVVRRRMSSTK